MHNESLVSHFEQLKQLEGPTTEELFPVGLKVIVSLDGFDTPLATGRISKLHDLACGKLAEVRVDPNSSYGKAAETVLAPLSNIESQVDYLRRIGS